MLTLEHRHEPATDRHVEIRVKGKPIRVPAATIDGRTVVVAGRWLKIGSIRDELVVEGEPVKDPASLIAQLKQSGLKADILAFGQKLPALTPLHDYYFEWDNVAAIR